MVDGLYALNCNCFLAMATAAWLTGCTLLLMRSFPCLPISFPVIYITGRAKAMRFSPEKNVFSPHSEHVD